MQDRVKRAFDEYVDRDIMLDRAEVIVASQVRDVVGVAGDQVIHRDNGVALGQKAIAQMGTEKACAAGVQDTHCLSISSRMQNAECKMQSNMQISILHFSFYILHYNIVSMHLCPKPPPGW